MKLSKTRKLKKILSRRKTNRLSIRNKLSRTMVNYH